jgi:predicted DCC family thiol-disulfide oxidoreductase YuxK
LRPIHILLIYDIDVENEKIILLFDGYCNFCNSTVNFILKHDHRDRFRFAALQSDTGKKLLLQHGIHPEKTDSVILIRDGKYYLRSAASLRIAMNLGPGWKLLGVFYIIPPFLRNAVYNLIARNRYKWFGKRESCRMPDEKEKHKFI